MTRKVKCEEYRCSWHGEEIEVLTASNPFNIDFIISGCPKCREINSIVYVCDEPECWETVSCGTRTSMGYRSTCHKHRPEKG